MNYSNSIFLSGCLFLASLGQAGPLRVLNFQADSGYAHKSKPDALAMVAALGEANGWEVVSTGDASSLTQQDLARFDVIVFNNNCGTRGAIMSPGAQQSFQQYVRDGGGFVGIHCAGAIWNEGEPFQSWYEGLIGTRLVDHPPVQQARLKVEDRSHIATRHLSEEWIIEDEWHRFGSNPRANVTVLISVDEDSYEGKQKMGGDHPFTWYQDYDGGRSFFTSLGHTKETYADPDFRKMIKGAIVWAGTKEGSDMSFSRGELPIAEGLYLDLDADKGVELEAGDRVSAWSNQVRGNAVGRFEKRDAGRKVPGSGRPTLRRNVAEIGGHNTLVFRRQELVNTDEDAFDTLLTGKGYTWISVMAVDAQVKGKKDVNSFFGNLKNGSNYEGFWGCVSDDNRPWMGSRGWPRTEPGKQPLWNDKNPKVMSPEPLEAGKYYIVMGRMGAGQGLVDLDLYVDSTTPVATGRVPVNPEANPSRMVIGEERDAINHPGHESFTGEISRFIIYDHPLSDDELAAVVLALRNAYAL